VFNVFVLSSNRQPSLLSNASVYKLPRCHGDQFTAAVQSRGHAGEAETTGGGKLFSLSSGDSRGAWNQLAAMPTYDNERRSAIIALNNRGVLAAGQRTIAPLRFSFVEKFSYKNTKFGAENPPFWGYLGAKLKF